MTKGTKILPKLGEDGRLYYNYGIGLKVRMIEKGEEWTLEINNCTYLNGTEYYTVLRNEKPMPAQLSANRIKFLLSVSGQEIIAQGREKELPLLIEEVENYYAEQQEYYEKQLTKMANCAPYMEIRREMNALAFKIGTYEALEKPGVDDLVKKNVELEALANEILVKNGVDVNVIDKDVCPDCADKGFNAFGICACAYAQEGKIKNFNAQIRLKARAYQV